MWFGTTMGYVGLQRSLAQVRQMRLSILEPIRSRVRSNRRWEVSVPMSLQVPSYALPGMQTFVCQKSEGNLGIHFYPGKLMCEFQSLRP